MSQKTTKRENLYDSGLQCLKYRNVSDAARCFYDAAKAPDGHQEAGYLLGLIYLAQGNVKEAEYWFNQAIRPEGHPKAKEKLDHIKEAREARDEFERKENLKMKEAAKEEFKMDLYAMGNKSTEEFYSVMKEAEMDLELIEEAKGRSRYKNQ